MLHNKKVQNLIQDSKTKNKQRNDAYTRKQTKPTKKIEKNTQIIAVSRICCKFEVKFLYAVCDLFF